MGSNGRAILSCWIVGTLANPTESTTFREASSALRNGAGPLDQAHWPQVQPYYDLAEPRRLGSGFGLVLVLAASLSWILYFQSQSSPKIRSPAVLPLESLSGDASQDYFADGMTDALITDLAQISALRVISRTSVMTYKCVRGICGGRNRVAFRRTRTVHVTEKPRRKRSCYGLQNSLKVSCSASTLENPRVEAAA